MRGLYWMFALLSVCATAQNSTTPIGPQPTEKIEVDYSDEARLAGLEGTVQIRVAVAEDGTPRDLQVAGSLGLGLDEKALEAVRQRRFTPSACRLWPLSIPVEFLLPAKQSRWHLTRVVFEPPKGASRPVFVSAKYPLGSGLGLEVEPSPIDEARIVAAVGRQAWVIVSFDVDENGFPRNFEVPNASVNLWKNQVIALMREWRFTPGMKDGKPVAVRCTLNLVWGQRILTAIELAQARPAETPLTEPHPPMLPFQYPPPPPGVARIALSASEQFDSLIQRVAPEYPQAIGQACMGGVILFNVLIGTDGHVKQAVAINQGSAYIPEATQALMRWIYRPATLNGKPAEVTATVPIEVPLWKNPPQ